MSSLHPFDIDIPVRSRPHWHYGKIAMKRASTLTISTKCKDRLLQRHTSVAHGRGRYDMLHS